MLILEIESTDLTPRSMNGFTFSKALPKPEMDLTLLWAEEPGRGPVTILVLGANPRAEPGKMMTVVEATYLLSTEADPKTFVEWFSGKLKKD